jgi:hypothetical protein
LGQQLDFAFLLAVGVRLTRLQLLHDDMGRWMKQVSNKVSRNVMQLDLPKFCVIMTHLLNGSTRQSRPVAILCGMPALIVSNPNKREHFAAPDFG